MEDCKAVHMEFTVHGSVYSRELWAQCLLTGNLMSKLMSLEAQRRNSRGPFEGDLWCSEMFMCEKLHQQKLLFSPKQDQEKDGKSRRE